MSTHITRPGDDHPVISPRPHLDAAAIPTVDRPVDQAVSPAGERAGGPVAEQPQHHDAWNLVRDAQAGDTAAFGLLYDRYVDVVFRYTLLRLGDRSLAEDVTSETFLRALRRITSVSYQGRDVGAWFITIARNLVLDHVKSSRHRLEITTGKLDDNRQVTAGPEQRVMTEATNAELLRCVAQLNEDQRECIVLRFLQGMSVAETAKLMHRGEGAVKALQHRAVRRLAQLLPTDIR